MFANGPGDQGSIPDRDMPKTKHMVLDIALLNTQHYNEWIKGKWSSPGKGVHLGVVAFEKGAFGLPSTTVAIFTLYIFIE